MADVRALLAAERQSRRISHPHLTYSKTGALNCNVCNLNIKSEQLWPGHLKSLNHRKNIQKINVEPARPSKRKIESVEASDEAERNYEVDSRKKPKPGQPADRDILQPIPEEIMTPEPVPAPIQQPSPAAPQVEADVTHEAPMPAQPQQLQNIDEDEWAAFEREVAPLTNQDYAGAVVEAAPVSAAEINAQQQTNVPQQREDEAEAEKEDESRRMEEEFEVMEEMEDRVKRLRSRREALRTQDSTSIQDQIPAVVTATDTPMATDTRDNSHNAMSSDEDEVDDWYG